MAKNAVNYTGLIPETGDSFENATQNTTGSLEGIDVRLGELGSGKADLIGGKIPVDQIPLSMNDYREGYYKILDGLMYQDSSFTILLDKLTDVLYLDLNTTDTYRWTGTVYLFTGTGALSSQTKSGLMSAFDKKKLDKKVYTFDTIADAQAYSGFVEGDIIEVLGYYEKGDGGGHIRTYSLTDDGSGLTCGNGYLNILHSGLVLAPWFGAISSNSTDYKGAELQKFFDYLHMAKAQNGNIGSKNIYSNTPNHIIYDGTESIRGNFTLTSSGGGLIYSEIINDWGLKIGLSSTTSSAIGNINIFDLVVCVKGETQLGALKLFTENASGHAFWHSNFDRIGCVTDKGKALGIYNGVFECDFGYINLKGRRKHEASSDKTIDTSDINLYMCNESGLNNTISSLKFKFINSWGGFHGIKTDGTGGKYQPDFNCDEVHVFDTKSHGIYLTNQNYANVIKKVHCEFMGTTSFPSYGVYWNGAGIIESIEGGTVNSYTNDPKSDFMVGLAFCYNISNNPTIINSYSYYGLPDKYNVFIAYPNSTISKVKINSEKTYIGVSSNSNGKVESLKYIDTYSNGNISGRVEKNRYKITTNGGVTGRFQGLKLDANGIAITYNTSETDYETDTTVGYPIKINPSTSSPANMKLGFYDATAINKPTISGSKGSNVALTSLIAALVNLGLITDTTTT